MNSRCIKTRSRQTSREFWDAINYNNTDGSIARYCGYNRKTVTYQRKLRGYPSFCGAGRCQSWVYRPNATGPSVPRLAAFLP